MDKIIISHRGNLNGPNPARENSPEYIREALAAGFNVEVDIWWHEDSFWFGHDRPEFRVTNPFDLLDSRMWVHCKDLETLQHYIMFAGVQSKNPHPHYFTHWADDGVLTSSGLIWTYPGQRLCGFSIAVMPEHAPDWDVSGAAGICTDYPRKYK